MIVLCSGLVFCVSKRFSGVDKVLDNVTFFRIRRFVTENVVLIRNYDVFDQPLILSDKPIGPIGPDGCLMLYFHNDTMPFLELNFIFLPYVRRADAGKHTAALCFPW